MGFSQIVFSPHIYIRSSPRRPNRNPNRTLSNEEEEEEEEEEE